MKLFVHIDKKCTVDAKQHNMEKEVNNLAEKLKADQTTMGLEPYPKPFLVKKFGKKFRLVIEERKDGEDSLVVFLRLLLKTNPEYKSFWANPQDFHKKYKLNDERIQEILKEKRSKPDIGLPSLSEAEENYLYSLNYIVKSDEEFIFESKDWVERVRDEKHSSFLSDYWDLLYQEIDNPSEQAQSEFSNHGNAILFRRFPNEKILFLIAPVRNRDEINDFNGKYDELLEKNSYSRDKLMQLSRRAYPSVIVYDSKLWIEKTQKSTFANMSLSDEEIEILTTVTRGDDYPLFINGRPGSGKSTVLQYLFAEHLHAHLSTAEKPTSPPIYLTYNESLLNIARENVSDILRCDAEKAIKTGGKIDESQVQEILGSCFGNFRDFLYNMLPEENQKIFNKDKYIDFPIFRTKWNEKYSKSPDSEIRKISPELAWHVIRTYIKGMQQEEGDYFDDESYKNEFPRDKKTVTSETFTSIYKIFNDWYKELCENDGYWDDQDITRKLLDLDVEKNNEFSLSKYPVIYCDEAQDFTIIELQLIFRLSLYSKRNLQPHILQKIPFAFAGDPFQTLNPTGFNWEATQANFHDTIVSLLDRGQVSKLRFNFKELAFNYRSTKHIVNLCNLIQLMRGIAFGIKGLKPQNTWFFEASNTPKFYNINDAICTSPLTNHKELVIIVPCQEGEELEYVKNDPFLQNVALSEDGERIIRNVQSPIRAKGLEFSQVVIYKFGDECVHNYSKLLDLLNISEDSQIIEKEDLIPLEYFVNRLYVASSRAEKRLFIVDTEDGIRNFWKFFKEIDLKNYIEKYYKEIDNKKSDDGSHWKEDHLVRIAPGDTYSWTKERDNPEVLAEKFFVDGKNNRDIYQLELARQNFEAANKPEMALEVEASIAEFKDDYMRVGEINQELGKSEIALEWYWKAKGYKEIIELVKKFTKHEGKIEHRASLFMQSPKDHQQSKQILDDIYPCIKGGQIEIDEQWDYICGIAVQSVSESSQDCFQKLEWKDLFSKIEDLKAKGLLNDQERSINEIGARASGYPDSIEFLKKLGDNSRLSKQYEENPNIKLEYNQAEIIFSALINQKRFDLGQKFLINNFSIQRTGKLLAKIIDEKKTDELLRVTEILFDQLVSENKWAEAVNFANYHLIDDFSSDDKANDKEKIKNYKWVENSLHVQFIKRLSISEELVSESNRGLKRLISDYLYKILLTNNREIFNYSLTVYEAGAALERANMIIHCLRFYENVMDSDQPDDNSVISFAKQRWLKCKERQMGIQESNDKKNRIQKEIEEKMAAWEINSIDEIDEYPDVNLSTEPRNAVEITEKIFENGKTQEEINIKIEFMITINNNEVYVGRLFQDRHKMEFRNNETSDLVTIYANTLELKSTDIEREIKELRKHKDSAKYIVNKWNLVFTLRRGKSCVTVQINNNDPYKNIFTFRI